MHNAIDRKVDGIVGIIAVVKVGLALLHGARGHRRPRRLVDIDVDNRRSMITGLLNKCSKTKKRGIPGQEDQRKLLVWPIENHLCWRLLPC